MATFFGIEFNAAKKPVPPAAALVDKHGEPIDGQRPISASRPLAASGSAASAVPAAASAASKKSSLLAGGMTVSKVEDLPKYVRLGDVGDKAASFAALLVTGENAAVLAIRDDLWSNPSAASLRMLMQRDHQFTRMTNIRVTASVMSALKASSTTSQRDDKASNKAPEKQTELHIARALEMISSAIDKDASDIHLEVRTSGRDAPRVVQRMRMHGMLHTISVETTVEATQDWIEVVRGLYQNDDICGSQTRTGTTWSASQKQEGMLKPPIRNAEIRFESLPEKGGFDVVMRINGYEGKSAARKSLPELGLSLEHALDLSRAADAPHGLIVVVGATGSGKTTTVTTALALDTKAEEKKRISLEMPPEADIPWLSQLVVTSDTLKSMMDGVMRADPDIISGGEVRNAETGEMAQDFSITGHLTWVTCHANGVFIAIRRLASSRLGFDIDILTMRNFLRTVLYQSLVEKLCPECSQPAATHLSEEKQAVLVDKFGLKLSSLFVRHVHDPKVDAKKCARCHGLGIIGRTVVAELIVPSTEVLTLVREGNIVLAEKTWRLTRTAKFDEPGTRGKTYVEHALYKVSNREVCADGVFALENLYNYEVLPLASDIQLTAQSGLVLPFAPAGRASMEIA